MSIARILPCPFCGGPDTCDIVVSQKYGSFVRCAMCSSTGPIAGSEDETVERWNKAPRTQEMISLLRQTDLEKLAAENSMLRAEIEENKSSIYETRRETFDEIIDVLTHLKQGDEIYYD